MSFLGPPNSTVEGGKNATDDLLPLVYEQLRRLAAEMLRSERCGHTLQPTALVHEAYARICEVRQVTWRNPAHFFAFAADALRRALVDHARMRGAKKRRRGACLLVADSPDGGPRRLIDVMDLHEALGQLELLNPLQARVIELRFFGGLTSQEVAAELGVGLRTVEKHWMAARAWLSTQLDAGHDSSGV